MPLVMPGTGVVQCWKRGFCINAITHCTILLTTLHAFSVRLFPQYMNCSLSPILEMVAGTAAVIPVGLMCHLW